MADDDVITYIYSDPAQSDTQCIINFKGKATNGVLSVTSADVSEQNGSEREVTLKLAAAEAQKLHQDIEKWRQEHPISGNPTADPHAVEVQTLVGSLASPSHFSANGANGASIIQQVCRRHGA